ncbi:hypothetical protein CEUSTIGMA_g9491.t1 [Chlamydomonas eustigma]|uniref:Histone-lysine N-methyltransferase, H3 lysine-79 specific n=1 Tax=Chlamydomonas eustigma TaxID=1157962 RepID=A0A250XG84_9CHLO|nr:hypothetical protein CEUSTIGMA_g9491.t1 [Chlamydomonas eustigma]|eukprot:GAX82063.1 hypothetical protein CEUSTIGMA_g9491.t1 [Chlamydomonas eustigma]
MSLPVLRPVLCLRSKSHSSDGWFVVSRRGYLIPKKERQLVDSTGGSAVYGEVMPEGIQSIMQRMNLEKNDVFIDLGSGLGRSVIQIGLNQPEVRSIGIELSATRHEQAAWALDTVQSCHGLPVTNISLTLGDITTCSLEGGTHFMLCSTAFSASGCRMIAERLAATSTFKLLVTSRQLPPNPYLRKVGDFPCAYSWNLGGQAHVYAHHDLTKAPASCLSQFLSRDGLYWLPHDREWHLPIVAEEDKLA